MTDTLSAAQRSKIRRLAHAGGPSHDQQAGELNIVPFLDIITNVMMFVLASITITFTVTLGVKALTDRPGPHEPRPAALDLAIVIGVDGYYVKGRAASIAPGCVGTGQGVTIPRADGRSYDADALQRCVRRLKDEVPGADSERQAMVTASPNVPFQEVVRVMDALRSDVRGELFPDVVFTVVR